MTIPPNFLTALAISAGAILIGMLLGLAGLTTMGVIGLIVTGGILYALRFVGRYQVSKTASSPLTAEAQRESDLPAGRETSVRGVSNYQSDIRKVGLGKHTFVFVPEPENRYDKFAVKVCVQVGTRLIRVGYLPAGTETTVAIHQLGVLLSPTGEIITGPGVIDTGEVGLYARVQTPEWRAVRERILDLKKETAKSNGSFVSLSSSAPQENLATNFFRKMDIKNQQEFAGQLSKFQTEVGKHLVWFLLVPISDDQVDVHLSFPGEFHGPQVGRINKQYLSYARAYTSKGPVCGRGFVKVSIGGLVEPLLGDPDWK